MSDYTITLSETHEKALEHIRHKEGGLEKKAWVQHLVVRTLENHALTMRDVSLAAVVDMDDEEFAQLAPRREAARRAKEEARLAAEAAEQARKDAEDAREAERAAMEVPRG